MIVYRTLSKTLPNPLLSHSNFPSRLKIMHFQYLGVCLGILSVVTAAPSDSQTSPNAATNNLLRRSSAGTTFVCLSYQYLRFLPLILFDSMEDFRHLFRWLWTAWRNRDRDILCSASHLSTTVRISRMMLVETAAAAQRLEHLTAQEEVQKTHSVIWLH